MRILILGAGFIGLSGVVPALLDNNHEVTVVTRTPIIIRGVSHICADVYSNEFRKSVKELRPDVVITMICYNREQAEWTLELFSSVKQIIFTSTVCVYGGPLVRLPIRECDETNPITSYGINKLLAEKKFLSQSKVPVTILRLASTIAPNFPVLRQLSIDKHSTWLYRVIREEPVIIADGGQQMWSWCSSLDVGKVYAGAIGRSCCFGKVYNVTGPKTIQWLEYHQRIASLLGKEFMSVSISTEVLIASSLPTGLLREQAQWNQIYDITLIRDDIPEFCNFMTFEETLTPCIRTWKESSFLSDEKHDSIEDGIIRDNKLILASSTIQT